MIAAEKNNTIAIKVAIAVPLSRVFDYLPGEDPDCYRPGSRVLVPFGRGSKVGIVLGSGEPSVDISRLKPVKALLDVEPLLSPDIVSLVEWASRYYHCPIGEAFSAALPVLLRKPGVSQPKPPLSYKITQAGINLDIDSLARAPVQSQLLQFIRDSKSSVTGGECRLFDARWSAPMKQLIAKGLVETTAQAYPLEKPRPVFALNDEQQAAATAINNKLNVFYPSLLYGVTGSGKTEVYIDVARRVIASGKQVLVLLPEIGLTPQLLSRVRSALACRVEVLHSGLNDTERLLAWQAAVSGEASVVIGTRSAVFTPMPKLGFIVVDEEHDGSLKQQDGFRYHARDLAMVRARKAQIPIVLGSATPALETLHNTDRGLLELHKIENRAGVAIDPVMTLVDSRGGEIENGLSRRLLAGMEEVLARGEQVIVFINRRGYAPVLMCEECGTMADCNNCDAHMTVHVRSGRLRCHHCGAENRIPSTCSACEAQADKLIRVGSGTERIDEFLSEKFPDYKVLRIDRDSTSRKGELQRHLMMAASGEAQILVGTQMLAKGHDFPNVTLVGIVDADRGLFGADFRSVEQMGQLIVQVAGRAGRAEKRGAVMVQSRNPEHPLLDKLLAEGYGSFAKYLLEERRQTAWPPFVHIALLRAEAEPPGVARNYLDEVRRMAGSEDINPQSAVMVLGPAHAPMERLAGRYRAQLLFVCSQRKPLHQLLSWLRVALEQLPSSRKVRWSLDVDPHDML